ncbi:MAG TPA: CobD/CbiB family cobalamin biosynthesis protein [Acidimicrobiia bacterium]|nr:CobD/CbiB family cobalamin biosynthesis protein [Acidimicrobiia bacterium]
MSATGRVVEGVHGRRYRRSATGRAPRSAARDRTSTPLAGAFGLVADRLLGEPPAAVHPVAAFGQAMAALEQLLRWRDGKAGALGAGERPRNSSPAGRSAGVRPGAGERRAESWRDGRPAGAAYVAVGAGLGWGAGFALGPSLPAAAVATWLVVAGRALGDEARAIAARLADDDLDGARRRLPALVGRDPERLDAKGVARAVVESVAENTVDAVVAPACWAAAGGAAGAGFYRAVNTLDAMVGHRNERYHRFGWAAARLDDAANWVPARLAGLLVAAVRPGQAREILGAVVRPPVHPSPNAGVVEAAFAAALGLRLGGDTVYAGRVDPRPAFGTGRPPEVPDIDAAVRLSRDVTLALAALLAAPAVLGTLRRRPHGGAP